MSSVILLDDEIGQVRARFKRYRQRIAGLELDVKALEEAVESESQSGNYYREKLKAERETVARVRRQADDDRDEADRARYAVQDELNRCRLGRGRLTRG